MGETATGRSSVSRLDRFRLRYGYGFEKSDYDFYGLTRGRTVEDVRNYLGYHWFRYQIRGTLNSPWARSVTEDKWIFYRLIDSLGLPAPRTFGLYDPTYGTTWDLQRPLRTVEDVLHEVCRWRPRGVVLKPNGGHQGKDLLVLDDIDHDTGRAVVRGGGETTLEKAIAGVDVAGMGGYPGYIVQECFRNHPVIDEMAPYAANTLRVQTLLAEDGRAHVLGAVLRLGRKGDNADNFARGGIAVTIDTTTGVVGRGFTRKDGFVTEHPDSGVRFEGVQLPFWDDVVAAVTRGARCLTGLRSIGWDVALTPSGALVVEGNNDWGLQLLQVHTDGYLADPAFRKLMSGLGAPLPTGNVVQGLVGRWLWPVRTQLRR